MLSKADLKKITNKIINKFNPQYIYLFGSYAYGHPEENSDLDLLIIDEKAGTEKNYALNISLELFPRPFHLDLLTYTPDDFDNKKNLSFFKEIKNKGKLLYARE